MVSVTVLEEEQGEEYLEINEELFLNSYWEESERYSQFLYYPIHIGEVLDERYTIEHKLGHGGFSTVWMAHDAQTGKDVALKIIISDNVEDYEQSIQDDIVRGIRDTSRLVLFERTFTLCGYEGRKHQVLVFPLFGPNLDSRVDESSDARRMSAAKQLLEILKILHEGGIVHRDLNPGCVMWGMTTLDNQDLSTKYERFGRPQKARLRPQYWKFGELVKPIEVPDDLLSSKIYLGDFGLSIKAGTPIDMKVQSPLAYCAPERLHGVDPSFASDMWSYIAMFALCYTCFTPYVSQGYHDHLNHMADSLGPLPEEWKGRLAELPAEDESLYDPHRKLNPGVSLRAIIDRARPEISSAEKDLAVSVMMKVFRYRPEDRLTASQLLEDPSFKAIMELYGV